MKRFLNMFSIAAAAVAIAACGNTKRPNQRISSADPLTTQSVAVKAVIMSGRPMGRTTDAQIKVQIGGENIDSYRYAIVDDPAKCAIPKFYYPEDLTQFTSKDKLIETVVDTKGDYTLCVIGKDKIGHSQAYASATTASWSFEPATPAKTAAKDSTTTDQPVGPKGPNASSTTDTTVTGDLKVPKDTTTQTQAAPDSQPAATTIAATSAAPALASSHLPVQDLAAGPAPITSSSQTTADTTSAVAPSPSDKPTGNKPKVQAAPKAKIKAKTVTEAPSSTEAAPLKNNSTVGVTAVAPTLPESQSVDAANTQSDNANKQITDVWFRVGSVVSPRGLKSATVEVRKADQSVEIYEDGGLDTRTNSNKPMGVLKSKKTPTLEAHVSCSSSDCNFAEIILGEQGKAGGTKITAHTIGLDTISWDTNIDWSPFARPDGSYYYVLRQIWVTNGISRIALNVGSKLILKGDLNGSTQDLKVVQRNDLVPKVTEARILDANNEYLKIEFRVDGTLTSISLKPMDSRVKLGIKSSHN